MRASIQIVSSLLLFSCSLTSFAEESPTTLENSTPSLNTEFFKNIQLKQFTIDARANQPIDVKDPLLPLNQKVFAFNDTIDTYILRPIAVQYAKTIPEDARDGYTNFRNNLREPWSAVNQVLQGKPLVAGKTMGRFLINSLTSLGFADTAKRRDLNIEKDDLGTTLGVWGVPSGPYIMLPFLGPTTLRDGAAMLPDSYAKPQRYLLEDDKAYYANYAFDGLNTRTQLLSLEDLLQGDKYSFIRDAYLQQRAYTIATKRGDNIEEGLFSDDPFSDDLIDEDYEEEHSDINID